jgi:hypothetical protein
MCNHLVIDRYLQNRAIFYICKHANKEITEKLINECKKGKWKKLNKYAKKAPKRRGKRSDNETA